MASIGNTVFDTGLDSLDTLADRLDICSTEPTTFTEATTTYTLGNKLTPTVAAPSDRAGGGREVVIAEITDGNVTADGTAAWWALVDVSLSDLLATGAVTPSQDVTNGNTFSLSSFTIGIPDPA